LNPHHLNKVEMMQREHRKATKPEKTEVTVKEIETWLNSAEGKRAVKEALEEASQIPLLFNEVRPVNPAKFDKPITL